MVIAESPPPERVKTTAVSCEPKIAEHVAIKRCVGRPAKHKATTVTAPSADG